MYFTQPLTLIFLFQLLICSVGYGDICPGADMDIIGRAFIVVLSFCGLGMFCGPVMDFASSWTQDVPGGAVGAALTTLTLGIGLFTVLEDFTELEAAYFSIITGTTIGYGDRSPASDAGKIAAAIFAILVINVTGGLLEPAASFLSSYCVKRDAAVIEGDGKKEL
jgi:hypothetical protein